MITLVVCPNCDSRHIEQYHLVGTDPHVNYEIMPVVSIDAAIITHYSLCQECHLIFQNPRMSDKELDIFYRQGYYRRTINMTTRQMDISERYSAKISAEIITQHVGKVNSHLDIGCGRGYLLRAIDANVKMGVELDVDYVKAKGIVIYPTVKKVPPKIFDLVTAIHILEHVPKPLEFLRSMKKFAGKNGYLVIEVPTWKSPGGPLRLPHLFHFESDVLRLMCRSVGLKVIHTEFTPHLILICRVDLTKE